MRIMIKMLHRNLRILPSRLILHEENEKECAAADCHFMFACKRRRICTSGSTANILLSVSEQAHSRQSKRWYPAPRSFRNTFDTFSHETHLHVRIDREHANLSITCPEWLDLDGANNSSCPLTDCSHDPQLRVVCLCLLKEL